MWKILSGGVCEACPGVPLCTCGGTVKPDVVLYEESLDEKTLTGSICAIGQADLVMVGGTSLTVYPAAGLIQYYRGNRLVLINRDETPYDGYANLVLHRSLGEVFFRSCKDELAAWIEKASFIGFWLIWIFLDDFTLPLYHKACADLSFLCRLQYMMDVNWYVSAEHA